MQLIRSDEVNRAVIGDPIRKHVELITARELRGWVERVAVPRHFVNEAEQNRAIGDWLVKQFSDWGYDVQRQGPHQNIVAVPKGELRELTLVAAHYDSVPGCPGADDNASAVAAMLGCAKACARAKEGAVGFVAFNREEDGLLGSIDFVLNYLPTAGFKVLGAHVLEMVGYTSDEEGSQRVPPGLPIKLRDKGDFLGFLANRRSKEMMQRAIERGAGLDPSFPMLGLEVMVGMELVLPVLARSDHAPFWMGGLPAVMWTDTAEFRNPHYHQKSDTPATLDYNFLEKVSRTLLATVMEG